MVLSYVFWYSIQILFVVNFLILMYMAKANNPPVVFRNAFYFQPKGLARSRPISYWQLFLERCSSKFYQLFLVRDISSGGIIKVWLTSWSNGCLLSWFLCVSCIITYKGVFSFFNIYIKINFLIWELLIINFFTWTSS